MDLGAAGGGVGEDKASAEAKRIAGGFHRVAAGGDVVHEIGLAESQRFPGAGEIVLVGRDWAERVLVAGALGLNWVCTVDRFDNLANWIDGLLDYWIVAGHLTLNPSPQSGEGGAG